MHDIERDQEEERVGLAAVNERRGLDDPRPGGRASGPGACGWAPPGKSKNSSSRDGGGGNRGGAEVPFSTRPVAKPAALRQSAVVESEGGRPWRAPSPGNWVRHRIAAGIGPS